MLLLQIPIKKIECISGKTITGIIHVGANIGEESEEYSNNGIENVIWIEPLDGFNELKKLESKKGNIVFNYAISDKNSITQMLVANNIVSSSLRQLGTHKNMSPDVFIKETKTVITKRIDTLIEENKLNHLLYNMLMVDVQGTEDLVLEGCGKYLEAFDILYLELNKNEVYQGCKTSEQINKFLIAHNFQRIIAEDINALQTEEVFIRKSFKTYFVIQGHTKYCNEILYSYRNMSNVIWCTDEDSPDLSKIRNSKIILKTIPKMPYMFGRINKHIASSLAGIKAAKDLGAEFVIKIRSDIIMSDYQKFLNNMKTDGKIYSMMYVKHNDIVKPSPTMVNNTTHWLNMYFQGEVENICNFNYLTDWMFYGPIEKMIMMYKKCNLSDLNIEEIMCEMRVLASYLNNIGKKINMDYEYLKNDFGIIMGQMERLGIDIYSLKMKMNYSKMHVKNSIGAIPNVYISE